MLDKPLILGIHNYMSCVDELITAFDIATLHEAEPMPNRIESAIALKCATRRLLLKCGFDRHIFNELQLQSPDIGQGIVRIVFPKPEHPESRQFLDQFFKRLAYVRDDVNGFSERYNVCEDDIDDDDAYNDLYISEDPDQYYLSGSFSDIVSGLMNYLSYYKDEDLANYENDESFNRTHSQVQNCFNLSYGYKPH